MNTDVPELALGRPQGERPTAQVLKRLTPFLMPYRGRIAIAMAFLLSAKVAGLAVPMVLKRLVDTLGMTATIAVLPVALLLAYGASRLSVTLFTEIAPDRVRARDGARLAHGDAAGVPPPARAVAALPPQPPHRRRRARCRARRQRDLRPARLDPVHDPADDPRSRAGHRVLVWPTTGCFAAITLADAGRLRRLHLRRHRVAHALLPRLGRGRHRTPAQRAVDSLLNYETVKYFGNEEHEARRYDDKPVARWKNAQVMSHKTLAVLNLGQTAIVAIGVTAMMWRAAGVVAGTHDRRRPGAGQCLPAAAVGAAEPARHDVSRGQAGAHQHRAPVRPARRAAGRARRRAARSRCNRAAAGRVRGTCASPTTRAAKSCRRRLRDSAGGTGRGGRAFGQRQVDAGAAAVSLLRRRQRHRITRSTAATSATTPRTRCARRSGIVPQDTVLFNDTIRYNIRYGRPERHGRGSRSRRARRAHPRPHRVAARTATTLRSANAA